MNGPFTRRNHNERKMRMRAPTLRGIRRSSPHGGAVLAFCPGRIDENAPQPDKNAKKKTLHAHISDRTNAGCHATGL
jgi:hypothetical protein